MREHPDLELENEHRDSEVGWTLQRLGWLAMLLLVIAALLGVFGAGPVDRVHIRGNGLDLLYSRFQRMSSTRTVQLTVPVSHSDVTQIWVEREYIQQFELSTVVPEPESSTSSADKVLFTFRTLTGQPFVATFHLRAAEGTFGPLSGTVGIEGSGQVTISQFIWP